MDDWEQRFNDKSRRRSERERRERRHRLTRIAVGAMLIVILAAIGIGQLATHQ